MHEHVTQLAVLRVVEAVGQHFGPQRAAQSRNRRSSEVAARPGIAAVHGGSRATAAGDEKLRVCGRARAAHRGASDESDNQDGGIRCRSVNGSSMMN